MARWTALSAALAAAVIAAGCGSSEQTAEERSVIPPPAEQQPAMSIETRTDTVATIHPPAQEPPVKPPAAAVAAPRFKVQIGAFRDPQHASLVQNLARERFALAASNEYDTGSGTYRIRIGSFETRQEAEDFRKKMQQQFPGEYGDAWIIVPDGESK